MPGQADFPPIPEPFPDALESVARHTLQINGTTAGSRRTYNFIVDASVTFTAVDDPVNEKLDITLEAANLTTGDIKESLQTASHGNWLLCNGATFDGGTWPSLATLLGGTTLPDLRGRSPMGSGQGAGLTSRALKDSLGEETHLLTLAEIAQHSHTLSAHTHNMNSHTHNMNSHTHGLNSHTHTLSNHTHAMESHTHGVPSEAFYTSGNNGAFDLAVTSVGSGTNYKNTVLVTATPGQFGGAFGPSTNTSGTPSTSDTAGPSTASTQGPSTASTLGPSSDVTSSVPGVAATAFGVVHPVYVVNFFIYAG